MNKPKEIGRLALRVETNMWNAYFAALDTMDGALPIGSIAIAAVAHNPERRAAFQRMMTEFVAEMISAISGERPDMVVCEAPPNERIGSFLIRR